jgi:hypothetical protein
MAVAVSLLIITLGVIQKNDLDASSRDQTRKTAINAFYYGLTQGYYPQHKFYPPSIIAKDLPYIDAALFRDPEGRKIGEPQSDYHYLGLNCDDDHCQKFELSAHLEKESTYRKSTP